MARTMMGVKHPATTIMNHVLVKLLAFDTLRNTQRTWRQFLGFANELVEGQQGEEGT